MNDFYKRADQSNGIFENDLYAVSKIPSIPDRRYGIHLKRTGQFAIFSSFSDGEKFYYSYYSSDAAFQQETPLDPLGEVFDDIKNLY